MYKFWIFLHLLGVVVWVGGMFFSHMALRPAVAALEPAVRLPLMANVLKSFFNWVTVSIVLVLVSGMALLANAGKPPISIHLMVGIGIIMMLIFGHLRFAPFKRLQRAVAAQDWPQAGQHMGQIRMMVGINLVLGLLTLAIATVGRML